MTLIEKIDSRIAELKAEKARAKKATRWQSRLDKMAERKNNPKKESEFCREYDLDLIIFNRQKKGHVTPSIESLKKVEDAFKSEGV